MLLLLHRVLILLQALLLALIDFSLALFLRATMQNAVREGRIAHAYLFCGPRGTGKTTTTFSKQGEVTQPIQDDMVAIWPGGELSITDEVLREPDDMYGDNKQ